jgi:Flp pilus assembly protein CpaB
VSRRGRAIAFALAALFAAGAAAALADGYGARVSRGYGELRTVVIATAALKPGRAIDPAQVEAALEPRRVPARFVPPGAFADPAAAIGLVPAVPVPAGSYLLASQLRTPRSEPGFTGLGRGRQPVEIAVGGAGALLVGGARPAGSRVDVVVTAEPTGSGPGRTYVAAASVPLLALAPGAEGAGEGPAVATLGLTRPQALRLIAAESFARKLTLLADG